jgi:hypothetical protein
MLTKIFGSNSIFSLVILILLTIVLWSRMLFSNIFITSYIPASPFYNQLCTLLGNMNIIAFFLCIGMVIFQALLLNNILIENELLPRKTYMAAFLYVLYISSFRDIVVFHPVLIAFLLLSAALFNLMKLYDRKEGYSLVFNIAFFVSLASLFYFPAIVFILFIWACFIVYRLFSWREWFISILGLLLPYLFLGTYYFWTERLQEKIAEYEQAFSVINFHELSPSFSAWIILGFSALMILFSVFRILRLINEKAIRIRKQLAIILWLFVISYLAMTLSPHYRIFGFLSLVAPLSVLVSVYIASVRKELRSEIILWLLLALVVFNRLELLESLKGIF